MANASNVIIRNLSFRDWNDDAINVQYSTRVWVDHNSFTNGYDGAVDIKRASDYVTVSWNGVYGHDKSMLLGHSDDNASEDRGKLRVTYHHNWFDGSGTRHPRVRKVPVRCAPASWRARVPGASTSKKIISAAARSYVRAAAMRGHHPG